MIVQSSATSNRQPAAATTATSASIQQRCVCFQPRWLLWRRRWTGHVLPFWGLLLEQQEVTSMSVLISILLLYLGLNLGMSRLWGTPLRGRIGYCIIHPASKSKKDQQGECWNVCSTIFFLLRVRCSHRRLVPIWDWLAHVRDQSNAAGLRTKKRGRTVIYTKLFINF